MSENDMFIEFMKIMENKFKIENKKHGDSWKTVEIYKLRRFLKQHVDKWVDNLNKENLKQEILDLIDIANYCVMISYRIKNKKEE